MAAGTVIVNTKSALTVADTVFMQINGLDYKVMFPEVMRLSDRDINTIKGGFDHRHQKKQLRYVPPGGLKGERGAEHQFRYAC